MIGTLIGAGLGLASSIAGGIANRKARRKQEQMLAQQQRDNQAWYDRKYNEDPTKRADTVRLLTQMQEQIKNRNRAAKGRQAVMGGTEPRSLLILPMLLLVWLVLPPISLLRLIVVAVVARLLNVLTWHRLPILIWLTWMPR